VGISVPKGIRGSISAGCHSDRPHYGLGLCVQCYSKQLRAKNRDKIRERDKKWRIANAEKHKAQQRIRHRRSQLKHKFGISLEEYNALINAQNGVCAICKKPETVWPSLPIDHDHKTGKVRGLLCTKCNLGLGSFRDNIESLEAAIAYLKRYK
jgi:Autographiviridae endonuclease VII